MRRRDAPAPGSLAPRAARLAAITLLSRRDYTREELRTRLVEKGATADEAAALVLMLSAEGLVDDRRLAAAYIRTASAVKGRGPHRIEQALVARGVDKAVVRELLGELTAEDEIAQIRRILVAKRVGPDPDAPTRRRLFQHLMRRGFSTGAIVRVLRHEDED